MREKCPNTEFFSGPYLDTFQAVIANKKCSWQEFTHNLIFGLAL